MIFNGYNPYAPPKSTPPLPANEIPLAVLKGARDVYATHLSPDGERAYVEKPDGVRVFFWDDGSKAFGSSFPCDGLPGEVVAIPDS